MWLHVSLLEGAEGDLITEEEKVMWQSRDWSGVAKEYQQPPIAGKGKEWIFP